MFPCQLVTSPSLASCHWTTLSCIRGTVQHPGSGASIASAVRDEAEYVGVYVRVVEKGAAIRFVKLVLSRCDDVDESSVLRESRWAHQGCPSSVWKH